MGLLYDAVRLLQFGEQLFLCPFHAWGDRGSRHDSFIVIAFTSGSELCCRTGVLNNLVQFYMMIGAATFYVLGKPVTCARFASIAGHGILGLVAESAGPLSASMYA